MRARCGAEIWACLCLTSHRHAVLVYLSYSSNLASTGCKKATSCYLWYMNPLTSPEIQTGATHEATTHIFFLQYQFLHHLSEPIHKIRNSSTTINQPDTRVYSCFDAFTRSRCRASFCFVVLLSAYSFCFLSFSPFTPIFLCDCSIAQFITSIPPPKTTLK